MFDRDTLSPMQQLIRSQDTPLVAGGLGQRFPSEILVLRKSDGSGLGSNARTGCVALPKSCLCAQFVVNLTGVWSACQAVGVLDKNDSNGHMPASLAGTETLRA